MRLFLVVILTLFCSTAYAQNLRYTENQFVDLLVEIRCIQKTNPGIPHEELVSEIKQKSKSLNIYSFNWDQYLVAHKYYTSKPDFLERKMMPIGLRISECVQGKISTGLSDDFYGVPIYNECTIVEKVDSPALEVAFIRLLSKDATHEILTFYKEVTMSYEPSISRVNGIETIEFKQEGKDRSVMIEKVPDGNEITLGVEK